mgnify:CR=1 FL=1|jgi:FixJ family two-component response regulator|tara:strand:+ start:130 stop:465 length:336 start_codon:yes stop_codon:yes gene_type:complete
MKRLLRSGGFDVETFTSGRAFLDAVSPDTPGCVVVDVQMPGMSGLELQDQMTAADYRLSVVFITARPNAADRRRALRGGAIQYLEQPVSADVLFACVKAVRPPIRARVRGR